MITGIELAEHAVQLASRCPVTECPLLLETAEAALRDLPMSAAGVSAGAREILAIRLRGLRERLSVLKKALARSQIILFRYSHQAGMTAQEYSPAGLSDPLPEPTLVMARF